MGFSQITLRKIFDKTGGYCYHCGKKLSFSNYGSLSGKGSWEVDHSMPLSKGGTDHLNNLLPSCIPCNRDKSALTTSQYRKQYKEEPEDPILVFISGMMLLGLFLGFVNQIFKSSKGK
jgi:5-methylcytosine-specific restriction endonuclease McrA